MTARVPCGFEGFQAPEVSHAIVAFSGRTELWWLRLLKPGFRHCLVALRVAEAWLVYDPLAHATSLRLVLGDPEGRLFGRLLAEGYLPVPVRCRAPLQRALPPAPFTCVEAAKRLIGLRAWRVATPWQLFRCLTRGEENRP